MMMNILLMNEYNVYKYNLMFMNIDDECNELKNIILNDDGFNY